MKNITPFIILTLILFSCNNKEDKIEMYLLKKHIRTEEGIPLLELAKIKKIPIDEDIKRLSKYNFDTISKTIIFGGKYTVEQSDFKKLPFLNDNDFISLELDKSKFNLSEKAKNKISKLKSSTQFVITVNKKPVISGYFRHHYSSNIISWNYFSYINKETDDENLKKDIDFILFQNKGYDKWKPYKANLNKYPILINTFRKSNRLIN